LLKDNQILTATEIANKVGAHPDTTFRMLRAVAAAGFVNQLPDQKFQLNETGNILRSDVPGSLRASLISELDYPHWQIWGNNIDAVKAGTTQIDKYLGGDDVWTWYGKNPEAGEMFATSMSGLSYSSVEAVLKVYEFPKNIKKVVDIGGSEGIFVQGVLSKVPDAHGITFDLPEIAGIATKKIENSNYSSRLQAIGGDFFKSVPADGDVYLLKYILHDWGDDHCITILSNIEKVMNPHGHVIVVEMEIDEISKPGNFWPYGMDMNMALVTPGGRERSIREYESLFSKVGLKLNRTVSCLNGMVVLECSKIGV